MFRLVECKNPELLSILIPGNRYHNLSGLKVPKINGIRLCKWCLKNELSPRAHYCSDKCRESAYILTHPQTRQGVVYLLLRQRFKCANCIYSWKELFRDILKHIKKYNMEVSYSRVGYWISGTDRETNIPNEIRKHRGVQVDHIIPVSENGDTYGFDNCQALCIDCHREKSRKL